jgi:hypothetical protein
MWVRVEIQLGGAFDEAVGSGGAPRTRFTVVETCGARRTVLPPDDVQLQVTTVQF